VNAIKKHSPNKFTIIWGQNSIRAATSQRREEVNDDNEEEEEEKEYCGYKDIGELG
jgi:hypothetical protein